MKVRSINNLRERLKLINDIPHFDRSLSDGEKLMIMALSVKKGAEVIAVFKGKNLKGAMSFRQAENKIKRINTGVLEKKKGYGSAMVRYLRNKYPDRTQWCLSIAPEWCKKLGMKLIATKEDGRFHFEGFEND